MGLRMARREDEVVFALLEVLDLEPDAKVIAVGLEVPAHG
jgi:hypothetical protein